MCNIKTQFHLRFLLAVACRSLCYGIPKDKIDLALSKTKFCQGLREHEADPSECLKKQIKRTDIASHRTPIRLLRLKLPICR
jgi:hypothetical protein